MNKFQTVYGVKIYPIDYLLENDLTESDLENLLGSANKKSLVYSIILGMLNYVGIKKRNCDIIKQITKDSKWFTKYQWTSKQCLEYEQKIAKIIQKLYLYSEERALSVAQWYISLYGLKVQGNTIDL